VLCEKIFTNPAERGDFFWMCFQNKNSAASFLAPVGPPVKPASQVAKKQLACIFLTDYE